MADKPERNDQDRAPRWVKVFGIIVIILVLVFVVLGLTGRGFGGHRPPIQHGVRQS